MGRSGDLNYSYRVAGTQVPGRSHIKKGTQCQDRTFHMRTDDTCAISLADGAGSYSKSEIGAGVASESVVHILCDDFEALFDKGERVISTVIYNQIHQKLDKVAMDSGTTIKEFSSTLLFVAVSGGRYIAGHIGDGLIGIFVDDGVQVLSYPDIGEYHNETYFTTTSNALDHFRIHIGNIENIKGFILMSDGTCSSLFSKSSGSLTKANSSIFSWLMDENNSEKEVQTALRANIENVLQKKTTDDCSINVMTIKSTIGEAPMKTGLFSDVYTRIQKIINSLFKVKRN